MKALWNVFFVLILLTVPTTLSAALDFSGVKGLATRLGGQNLASKVVFEEWNGVEGDAARIEPIDGTKFKIRATSLRLASLALGTYLRDVAKGHVSWCGNRIPTRWPMPREAIEVKPRYPQAMAYNYCTLAYTMAFWGKASWQKEIDRLALNGYSTALVMAGVPKIWQLTLKDMGYTVEQQRDFIADDAAQAWWLMGNLQAFGDQTAAGRFPVVNDAFIETDAELGRWMIRAMREVGIEPLLQGFVGLVPSTTREDQFKEQARVFRTGSYMKTMKSPDLLDPTCAAFRTFSAAWNRNLKRVYGLNDPKDHPKYLGGDLFHEAAPPESMTYEQKVDCARFIQRDQQQAFPGVTWVLQSWQGSPHPTLRDGLDPKCTLIQYLDQTMSSSGSRSEVSYVNRKTGETMPWVWVEVFNFGGNTGMHGALRRLRTLGNLGEGVKDFRGYGLLSEGLETNPLTYDLYHWAMNRPTKDEQNLDDREFKQWMKEYRMRRYGFTDDNLREAYLIFARTVWDCARDQQGTVESVFCANPSYEVGSVSLWGPRTGTPYDRRELVKAARHMLRAAKAHPELLKRETFLYDFVEVFQQILADKAREILPSCRDSKQRRVMFRVMLDKLDRILSCSDEWRLDRKEARTREKAPWKGVAAYRRMITTWTPGTLGQTPLSQYAHRSYAGLVRHYYAAKWNAFFDVTEGKMSQAAYDDFCLKLERDFPTMKLPATPTNEDPIAVASEILSYIELLDSGR